MSGNIRFYPICDLTVEEVYERMDEGQRQHMANKLNKHGYVNPKVQANPSIEELVERFGRSHVLLLVAEAGR